jgi:hypothetical protein
LQGWSACTDKSDMHSNRGTDGDAGLDVQW